VLQFDQSRGYGFVAADDGGEDIFLHASVYDGDPYELTPGMRVEFKIMAGDRGRKAFAARLITDQTDPEDATAAAATALPAGPVPVVTTAAPTSHGSDEEPMCDVLSQGEFGQELTELLLTNAPLLTGQQILEVRQSVLELARKHGWVDV
jgi:cold shock CspA family protein